MSLDRLQASKANRVKIGKGEPHNSEGSSGDFTLRQTTEGVILYVKYVDKWYRVGRLKSVAGRGEGRVEGRHKVTTNEAIIKSAGSNMSITSNEIDVDKGDFTLDSSGDIILNADDGVVRIKDASTFHFTFDCDNTKMIIYDDDNILDLFTIAVGTNAATTISTDDNGSAVGHLTLQPDGDLLVNPAGDFYILHDADNYFKIAVGADGATAITTVDDGVSASGNMTIIPDGSFTAGPSANWGSIIQGTSVKLDASGDIYIDAAGGCINFLDNDVMVAEFNSGGGGRLRLYDDADDGDYLNINVQANGYSYISTTDSAGGNQADLEIQPQGDLNLDPVTHIVKVLDNTVGFTQTEPTFDATDTIVDFSITGNKQKLTLTDNCADIHFKFPAMSGNFICVLLQDGTGGRTISNWKTQDSAGNAGAGNSGLVLWAGGTAPTNTETANKADIASFYWDADNEIAYGMYTYNF